MSAKMAQTTGEQDETNDDEQTQSEYVETADGWATVWTDNVEGTDVWVTQHVVDKPEGRTAAHTVRCTWRVHKVGQKRWIVSAEQQKRMFNGCASGKPKVTIGAHVEKLRSELNYHYLMTSNASSSTDLEIEFEGVEEI